MGVEPEELAERMSRLGQSMIPNNKKHSIGSQDMPELEEVSPKSAFSVPINNVGRKYNMEQHTRSSDSGFTPIPIINLRSDSPQSIRSGASGAYGTTQMESQIGSYRMQGSDFNMLMSETRMQNTEMRMNMQRVGDKVDTLLSLQLAGRRLSNVEDKVTNEDILKKLEGIMDQNHELKDLVSKRGIANGEEELLAEENALKQQKLNEQSEMLKRLEQIQLAEMAEKSVKKEVKSEVKKVLNSTGKFLVSQFNKDQTFSGPDAQQIIGQSFKLISDRLTEKYE